MLAEFRIINDPLRPSISTNLCAVCCRNKEKDSIQIGCCSYEPEFCLFDLVYLYLHYPDIYHSVLEKGQIIEGYNGIMVETKVGLNHCPFATNRGCILPKDAMTPLCRLYICREAAIFGPAIIEERFDEYFSSEEYHLNKYLNSKLVYDQSFTSAKLHNFIVEFSQPINSIIAKIDRINPPIETFHKEITIETFSI